MGREAIDNTDLTVHVKSELLGLKNVEMRKVKCRLLREKAAGGVSAKPEKIP